MNRDFKGIWIPREIWLAKDLSCIEKCLWAEIHSLFDRETGGCYASNEYLCEFFGIKERRLQEMMASLKSKGWIVQVSFDGRTRVIKAVIPPEDFQKSDDYAQQTGGKVHHRGAEKCTSDMQDSAPLSYIREQSIEQSKEPSLKVPKEPDAAIAACAGGDDFPKPKPKREKSEFSIKVREVANQMLKILAQYSPVYRPPSDMTKFLSHVQEMIERDKQDPAVVLKAFEWALADNEKRGDFNGWQGIVATNNKGGKTTTPAEIFRKHFSKIHSQMGSREKRKFAPCSDDDKAIEKMREMSARAI